MNLVEDFTAYEDWINPKVPDRVNLAGNPKAIWLLSDVHLGHVSCDVEKFKRHTAYARKLGAWVFSLGDLCETVTLSSSVSSKGALFEQFNPREGGSINFQTDYITHLLRGLDVKILLDGNHERRLARQGYDLSRELARRLEARYVPAFASIRVGKVRIMVHHGEGSVKFFDYARRDWPNHDVLAAGHNHHLSVDLVLEGGTRTVSCIRTGSYLYLPRYQMERASSYSNVPTGSCMLHLSDGKVERVEILS